MRFQKLSERESSLEERKRHEDLYSTLAIKEDLAKKLGLEFPIRREEGSMRAARVLPEAPAVKDSVASAPTDANQPKKQRKKGDALFFFFPTIGLFRTQ